MKKLMLKLAGMMLLAALYGCGSAGGSATPVTDSYVFPPGQTTLAFTAMSTARLQAPLSGIDISLTLPAGMEVATSTGASGPIVTPAVTPGLALAGTNLAFGAYSASSGKAHLTMATTSDSYRSGEFLRLTCTVAPDSTVTLGSVKGSLTVLKVVGYDAVSKSTVDLTGLVKVTVGVP